MTVVAARKHPTKLLEDELVGFEDERGSGPVPTNRPLV